MMICSGHHIMSMSIHAGGAAGYMCGTLLKVCPPKGSSDLKSNGSSSEDAEDLPETPQEVAALRFESQGDVGGSEEAVSGSDSEAGSNSEGGSAGAGRADDEL